MSEQPQVKKAFVNLINFLQENADKKVKSILPKAIAMCAPRQGGGGGAATSFHRDENGNVVAQRCYYHQKWMDPAIVEFGTKTNSASGLNSMCKDGMSKWTKQQRVAKKQKEDLLAAVAAGDVPSDEIATRLAKIEDDCKAVVAIDGNYQGFDTLEECLAFSEANPGFELVMNETADEEEAA